MSNWSKSFVIAGAALLLLASLTGSAIAQESVTSREQTNQQPPQAITSPQISQSRTTTGSLSGTVMDSNGAVLQGARVTLKASSGSIAGKVKSGANGQFAFSGLQPGSYILTVSAPGMTSFTSAPLTLKAEGFLMLPPVKLSIRRLTTSVTVNGNKTELSEQQVQIALQQRIGGVIPNFYSSYNWNAPPMLAKQKFQLSVRSLIDPVSFLEVAGIAGAEQYQGIFPAYGSGFEGYGKRYAAALANHASGTLLGRAVFPSIFHQDPRYFYKGKGTVWSRALYAMSTAVVARGDDGRWQPNYSHVLGNFSSAAISNLYYPASDRGASLVVLNGLANTGADAVSGLFREFVLKRLTSHVP